LHNRFHWRMSRFGSNGLDGLQSAGEVETQREHRTPTARPGPTASRAASPPWSGWPFEFTRGRDPANEGQGVHAFNCIASRPSQDPQDFRPSRRRFDSIPAVCERVFPPARPSRHRGNLIWRLELGFRQSTSKPTLAGDRGPRFGHLSVEASSQRCLTRLSVWVPVLGDATFSDIIKVPGLSAAGLSRRHLPR